MANHFRIRAPAIYQNCPPHMDYAAWLPLMRHYGLPTRLLDWTESLSVAAFFAVNGLGDEEKHVVWALSPAHLNLSSVGHVIPFLTDDRVSLIVSDAYSGRQTLAKNIAVIAPRSDLRMVAQLGNYTIHGNRTALEADPITSPALAKIEIPKAACDRIKFDLSLVGIRLSTLFPDLGHLAAEISALKPPVAMP